MAFAAVPGPSLDAHQGAPLLTVVICTFNRASLLSRCLAELMRQAPGIPAGELDIMVVDNNSSDDTALICERFRAEWPLLRYVFEPQQGLSHARNRGANESLGTYVGYLDDDALPGPEYLQNLMAVLVRHSPDIAGGPVLPFYTSPKPFWFQDELEVRQHARGTGFFDCPVSGGNFIIRRELLLKLGMFSTDYGMLGGQLRLGEERNLIERYRAANAPTDRKIYYSQNCFIYHHVPSEKMRIGYFVRRAFESGRLKVALARELGTARPDDLGRPAGGGNRLQRIIRGEKGVYLPLRAMHYITLVLGMTYEALINQLSGRTEMSKI